MRSILVAAQPGRSGRTRVETALSLARSTRGHVTLLVDTPIDRYVAIDGMGGSVVATDVLRAMLAEDDAYAKRVDADLAREDVCCDVLRAEAEPVDALAAAARLADVVVMSRADPLAADLAFAVRCPILAVNDDRPVDFPLGRVAIAWDGGSEAATALRAAVPLLTPATEVIVLTADDTTEFPATDAVAYLSRHGVHAELKVVPRGKSAAQALSDAVAASRPDLLVMGAYGHGRVREFLFGGVTRHILESEEAPPLLLAR